MRRFSLPIARNDLAVTIADSTTFMILILMPVLLIAFVKPVFELALVDEGFAFANGAEQAVPGMATMFALFLVNYVGLSVFQEHYWNTWDRLRATSARSVEIVVGKSLAPLGIAIVQQVTLLIVGITVFDLRVRGSFVALGAVSISLCICLVCLGFAVLSLARNVRQVGAIGNLLAMLSGGLGGALAPIALLPGWAQALGRIFPSYWAISGFRTVLLRGGGLGDVVRPVGMLVLFAVVFGAVALTRFRLAAPKEL